MPENPIVSHTVVDPSTVKRGDEVFLFGRYREVADLVMTADSGKRLFFRDSRWSYVMDSGTTLSARRELAVEDSTAANSASETAGETMRLPEMKWYGARKRLSSADQDEFDTVVRAYRESGHTAHQIANFSGRSISAVRASLNRTKDVPGVQG